ncbi:hypothetical protein [Streptomyces syringium]|uniref:hypothetical protein n=1 Tax=Streptomyces syringium TaxID=76729 RepID=UPI0033C470D1
MMLALGAVLGSALTLIALTAWRRINRPNHCTWCAEASAQPNSQHDARQCKGYVQERRRERLARKADGQQAVEPDPFGATYLLPEEIAERYGALDKAEGGSAGGTPAPAVGATPQ